MDPHRHPALTYLAILVVGVALGASGVVAHGVPIPSVHDEFSYLFAGETFARFRLANPSPPVPPAFFSPHILVEPTFAAKYPPAQGLFLALGVLVGLPIAGVWLSGALAAMALHWSAVPLMGERYAWLPTTFFMIALLFASTWVSSYWGGFVPFTGGALVLGFVLRLRHGLPHLPAFAALGVGLALLALSRPFEGLVLCAVCGLVFADEGLRVVRRGPSQALYGRMTLSAFIVGTAMAFQGAVDREVTGHVFTMPQTEFHRQYMSVPLFRWQSPTEPSRGDPRLLAVEQRFEIRDSWPRHLGYTLRMAWEAAGELGGGILLALLAGSTIYAIGLAPRLLTAALCVPLLQSGANYVHFSHYFAPIAPLWFLLPGLAGAFVAKRYRLPLGRVVFGTSALALASTLPNWTSGAQPPGPRHHHELVRRLTPEGPTLAVVRYSDDLSPHVSVVYNDPDLKNRVIFVNDVGWEGVCEVIRQFPGRSVVDVTVEPDSSLLSPSNRPTECDP